MKLGVGFFLKYFIAIGFTIFAFVNILYTFNLVGVIGGAWIGSPYGTEIDYSDKYFGVSTFISAFETFFDQNRWLDAADEMQGLLAWFTNQSHANTISMALFALFGENSATQFFSIALGIITLPADLMTIFGYLIYGLGMIVYIVGIAIQFLTFFIYLLSGACWTQLPDTYHLYMIPSGVFIP